MRKWLSALLAALLVAACLPALAFAEGELAHMDITVGLWDIDTSFSDEKDQAILAEVQNKFGVTFQPMNVGWGDYTDKYLVWAASGTMPDISGGVNVIGGSTFYSWVEDGVIRALPEDLSAYPDVAKYMELPEVVAYQVDGQNYFFPRMTYEDPSYWCMDRGLLIRKDWLANLGLEMPTNGEELLATMRAFTEDDPDGNGEADTIGFAYNAVHPVSQQIASYGYTDGRWVKGEDGWRIASYEANTIPLIDMLRTAFKNGWMDPDFASRATNDCQELFAAGRVGILAKQNSPKHVDIVYDLWVTIQPDVNFFDAVAIVPLQTEEATMFQEMSYWSETYVPSTVDDAKLERIMMIMNYLYADEGVMLTSYGFEGTDYSYDDAGQIVPTLPLNENGTMMTVGTKYAGGFLSGLAAWNGDMLQYVDPTIPLEIRAMCQAEYERRRANWISPNLDWEVAALNLVEKTEMSSNANAGWSTIIADTSDTPTEELYGQLLAEWNAQGYQAAYEAVTRAAAELGK